MYHSCVRIVREVLVVSCRTGCSRPPRDKVERVAGTADDKRFGAAVGRRRDELGFTRSQLSALARDAGLTNMHPNAITRIETGQQSIRLHEAIVFATLLNTSLDDLTSRAEGAEAEVRAVLDQAVTVDRCAEVALLAGRRFWAERDRLGELVDRLSPEAQSKLTSDQLDAIEGAQVHHDPMSEEISAMVDDANEAKGSRSQLELLARLLDERASDESAT